MWVAALRLQNLGNSSHSLPQEEQRDVHVTAHCCPLKELRCGLWLHRERPHSHAAEIDLRQLKPDGRILPLLAAGT